MCARQKVNTFLVTGSRSPARKEQESADSDRGREALQGLGWQGHNGQWSAWPDVLITISVVVPVCAQSPRLKYEYRPSTDRAQAKHRPDQAKPDHARPDPTRPEQRLSVPAGERTKGCLAALLPRAGNPFMPLANFCRCQQLNVCNCCCFCCCCLTLALVISLKLFGARHVLVLAVTYI